MVDSDRTYTPEEVDAVCASYAKEGKPADFSICWVEHDGDGNPTAAKLTPHNPSPANPVDLEN